MSKPTDKTLGEIIKETFREKGLNQSLIAKKMGVSKQVINQIDRRKRFDLPFLHDLKVASGVDFTSYLLNPFQKSTDYLPNETVSQLAEPGSNSSQLVELSLTIKIRSNPEQIAKMGDLITAFKNEANRLGFAMV